jgi:hypothetical protein
MNYNNGEQIGPQILLVSHIGVWFAIMIIDNHLDGFK